MTRPLHNFIWVQRPYFWPYFVPSQIAYFHPSTPICSWDKLEPKSETLASKANYAEVS